MRIDRWMFWSNGTRLKRVYAVSQKKTGMVLVRDQQEHTVGGDYDTRELGSWVEPSSLFVPWLEARS